MSIYEKLYDWQQSLVNSIEHNKSFGLFLDMGLGKTPISLALAEQHNCTKVIIITINTKTLESVTDEGSWLNWASKSAIKYEFSVKKDTHFNSNHPDLFIINYESLFNRSKSENSKLAKHVLEFVDSCKGHNVCIIVDESHKMKDIRSQQTQAINRLKLELNKKANSVFAYLLTGTPFTTGYIDLYSQLKFLGYPETKGNFVDMYCIRGNIPGLLGWQQPIVGYKNIEQLYRTIHKYAITIESNTVVKLPEQIFIEHTLPMNEDFKMFTNEKLPGKMIESYNKKRGIINSTFDKVSKINNPYYRDIEYDIKNCKSSDWFAETSGTFWLRARQLSIGFNGNAEKAKWYNNDRLNQLEKFLTENEDNYLLFYNYTPELIELYQICEKLGYNVDVYCGEMKSLAFYEKYASQTPEQRLTNKKNIIIANFASGSTGLNWQLYNKCIIFSMPLYKDWAQGLKRINRVGQTQTTFYHIFYQHNWLDEGMYDALKEQKDYSQKMFDSDLQRIQEMI